jgi:hypothetical protein
MVRLRLQGALVSDLRELVVAELAIEIADQVGDIGEIIKAEHLEQLDGGGIVLAVVNRRIGLAISFGKGGITEERLVGGLLFALVGGVGGPGVRRWRRRRVRRTTGITTSSSSSSSAATTSSSPKGGGSEGAVISTIRNVANVTSLITYLIIRASYFRASRDPSLPVLIPLCLKHSPGNEFCFRNSEVRLGRRVKL